MPKQLTDMIKRMTLPSVKQEQVPERIRKAINQHQAKSERLIAWVQLCVVATFALLYAASPKTFPEQVSFTPVPWVLTIYYLFTVLHLYNSHKRLVSDRLTYLSIVVDMLLVYLLIWSFHLQYMQPASFYLKAPTLLYVFIFIAMRALRFEIKFILFAGATAAVGWFLMILYVITSDPDHTMITKDYVVYLTSNSILIGAEFDKIISILIVTLVLAVAVYRARKLLMNSIIEANAAKDLSHFVPSQVIEAISHSQHEPRAGSARSYRAAIMFTDIVNFTSISEQMLANQVVTTINEYFAALEEILDQYNGTINQFQGDAILASFEHDCNDLNPSECAVQAALDIQALLKNRSFGKGLFLQTRIGINTGEVVGGLMGSTHRLIYTIHGDEVNLASRLEQLNKEYETEVLLSGNTQRACRQGLFNFSSKGRVTVKGRQQPTEIFSLEIDG